MAASEQRKLWRVCTFVPSPQYQNIICKFKLRFVCHLFGQRRLWRVCTNIHSKFVHLSVRCINASKMLSVRCAVKSSIKLMLVYQETTRYEPRHEISNNVVCATSKASDQPARKRSLIRAFASRLNILRVLSY